MLVLKTRRVTYKNNKPVTLVEKFPGPKKLMGEE
jgi:hypothetical protein